MTKSIEESRKGRGTLTSDCEGQNGVTEIIQPAPNDTARRGDVVNVYIPTGQCENMKEGRMYNYIYNEEHEPPRREFVS